MIIAGIGKPTFPMLYHLASSAAQYWQDLSARIKDATKDLSLDSVCLPEVQAKLNMTNTAVGYDEPQGNLEARHKTALALQRWYNNTGITADNILFTTGGAGGLYTIFNTINYLYPNGRILVPTPFYPLYRGSKNSNNLFEIDVMQNHRFILSPDALEEAIKDAYDLAKIDGNSPSALVLCNPNNPLGTVFSKQESIGIATVLKKYEDILIVLDEAYAEMIFEENKPKSLLCVAPELKDRMIILRSATKALSAAGERMALTIAFNKKIMEELTSINIDICGHTPVSLQHAYAEALTVIDEKNMEISSTYYRSQVEYATQELKKMQASIYGKDHKVSGTFYVIANLSELIGSELSPQVFRAIKLFTNQKYARIATIDTDEDIAYEFLFEENIMLTPCSYFGMDKKLGLLRITCCEGINNIAVIMSKIKKRLEKIRESSKKR